MPGKAQGPLPGGELAVVVRLALGSRARRGPAAAVPVAAVVAALHSGGLPLAHLREADHPDLTWLFASEAYRQLLVEHGRRKVDYETEFRAFLAETVKAALPVIVLKACGTFPYESSNLDLLLPPERMREAAGLLEAMGFLDLRHYREPHKTLHKKFLRGRDVAIFHLHDEVSWDGAIFLDRVSLWARCRPLPSFPGASQLDPAHLLGLTVAHAVYENAALRLADLRRALLALDSGPVEAAGLYEEATRRGWSHGLRLGLEVMAGLEQDLCGTSRLRGLLTGGGAPRHGRGTATVVPLGHLRCRWLFLRKILGARSDGLASRARLTCAYLGAKARAFSRVPRHPPLLVALSGVDGSGKSFYAARLHDLLRRCDVQSSLVWARGGSTRPLLRLKALARRAAGGTRSLGVQSEGAALRSVWQRILWPWVVCGELWLTYLVRVRGPLLLRRVVLCDRHTLDAAVDLAIRAGARGPRTRAPLRILEALSPRPDLQLLLDVSAEEALRRKHLGMERAQVEKRLALYRALAPPRVEIVDTEQEADCVAERIGRRVLDLVVGGPR